MKSISGILICLLYISIASAQVQDPLSPVQIMLFNEDYNQVIEYTDSLVVPDSLETRKLYYRGTAYRELSRFDSALHYYSLASELDSGNLGYLKAVGQTLKQLGRIKDAIDVYERIVTDAPSDMKSLADLASLYSARREYTRSLEVYQYLLEKDSLNYYFLKQAGKCYYELKQVDSALTRFESAFELNPADVFLAKQVSNIYLQKKDIGSALFSVSKGMLYDSSNVDLLKLRGYIWMLSGHYNMAITDLEYARTQDSSSVFIQKYLGMSYHDEKRFDEARETLLIAFELDSTDSEIAFFLGSACRRSLLEEEGIKYFYKAIELEKPDPKELKKVYLQLAELYRILHRFEEALGSFDEALLYDPSDNMIYYKMAQVYDHSLNRKKKAIEYYEKYLNEGQTDHRAFNASEGRSVALEEEAKRRINRLKEDLFFEGDQQ